MLEKLKRVRLNWKTRAQFNAILEDDCAATPVMPSVEWNFSGLPRLTGAWPNEDSDFSGPVKMDREVFQLIIVNRHA